MKKFAIVLAVFVLCAMSARAQPVERWNDWFGYNGSDDIFKCVQQTSDNGLVAVGYGYPGAADRVILVKYDRRGQVEWSQYYTTNPQRQYEANWVEQTLDRGYIIVGSREAETTGSYIYLLKVDRHGTSQGYLYIMQNGRDNCGYCVKQTPDNGFIITGYATPYAYPNDKQKVVLYKLDAQGNYEWHHYYGYNTARDYVGYNLQFTSDGGYVIVGSAQSDLGGQYVYVIKTDGGGIEEWHAFYGPSDRDNCGYRIEQTAKDGYIFTGYETPFVYPNDGTKAFLRKIDSTGTTEWLAHYGPISTFDYVGYSFVESHSGGYVVLGSAEMSVGGDNFFLVDTDASGNELGHSFLGGTTGNDIGYCIQRTGNGGYLLAGATETYGYPDFDGYLIYAR